MASLAILHRIRVVGARPCARTTSLIIRRLDRDDRAIRPRHSQVRPGNYNKTTPANHRDPLAVPLGFLPVVVEPHATHGLESHQCAKERTDERDQTVEDGNAAGNTV